MFMIRNKSFIAQILKVVSPLGEKLIFSSPLGVEIQKNYDSETLEFKLHSFRAFQLYVTNKIPTHGRRTVSVFQFSAHSFSTYFSLLMERLGPTTPRSEIKCSSP